VTRPETRRTLFRHSLYIPPWEKVRVVFVVLPPNGVEAQFECLTCGQRMDWSASSQYWMCPECEYEMTPKEAQDLHGLMTRALSDLCRWQKRSLLWDLVTWLRMRLGRGPKRLLP
jgi:DNA-directed RNA polymerase subunit RPC12/RpoP